MLAAHTPPAPVEERPHFLTVLFRKLRPAEGYPVILIALLAVMTLPLAAVDGEMIAGLEPARDISVVAFLVAWWLAHRRIRGGVAAVLLALGGAVLTSWLGVHVLRPGPVLHAGGRWLLWRLGSADTPAPVLDAFASQGQALAQFGQRFDWWFAGLIHGSGAADNLVVVGLACLLAWGLASWAAWWLARPGKVFVALLPTGIVLLNAVYWADRGYIYIWIYLAAFPLLLVLLRMVRQMIVWERAGLDYSPEIWPEVWGAGLVAAFLVAALAPSLPFITSREASAAFWRLFGNPYRQVEQHVGASFGAVQPGRSLIPAGGVSTGGLPRAHLLGGRPELAERVALRVHVRSAQPDERLYWRGQTFAVYTGRGWEDDNGALRRESFAAGEPWAPDMSSAMRHPVLVSVKAEESHRVMFFALGEPVSVDHPYWVELRGAGEVVALGARGQPSQYTIVSSVPDVDAAALRAAGADYPPQIAQIYLALPPDLPPELVRYAAEVTAPAPSNPYDRALAIESALRRLPYTLDIPLPPADRELVSWFLFDLKQGYCDYFATAMVVLARLNGIPARLAIGYSTGTHDPATGDYIVTELNGHSWPELYFPGAGWIPFEPTSSFALPTRVESVARPAAPAPYLPGEYAGQMDALRVSAAEVAVAQRKQLIVRGLLGGLNGLLLGYVALRLWRRARARRSAFPQDWAPGEAGASYARLLRWGRRLGCGPDPADTPREFAAQLAVAAAQVAGRSRAFPRTAAAAADVVHADAGALALAFEAATYGPDQPPSSSPPAGPARRAALWPALRRLWLARLTARRSAK